LEAEPEDLPKALARIHQELLSAGHRSRGTAATYYDRAVRACTYNVGDRRLHYYPPGEIEQGRKLRVSWRGLNRVVARHSSVSYSIRRELDDSEGTAHVNRLKKITEDSDLSDVRRPQYGMWPGVRRVLRGILSRRETRSKGTEYQVRSRGRNGFKWVPETAIPDVVRLAFALAEKEGALV
jgi:hypothetical protein